MDTLAAAVGEDAGTIEEVYEPYLIKNGFINRRPVEGLPQSWPAAIWVLRFRRLNNGDNPSVGCTVLAQMEYFAEKGCFSGIFVI